MLAAAELSQARRHSRRRRVGRATGRDVMRAEAELGWAPRRSRGDDADLAHAIGAQHVGGQYGSAPRISFFNPLPPKKI